MLRQIKIRIPLALAVAALLAGCGAPDRPLGAGATPAAVFATPELLEARRAADHVFPSQHAEYARRDHLVGAREAGRTALYSQLPPTRVVVRSEEVRVRATDDGYRVLERAGVRSYSAPATSAPAWRGHRHR